MEKEGALNEAQHTKKVENDLKMVAKMRLSVFELVWWVSLGPLD